MWVSIAPVSTLVSQTVNPANSCFDLIYLSVSLCSHALTVATGPWLLLVTMVTQSQKEIWTWTFRSVQVQQKCALPSFQPACRRTARGLCKAHLHPCRTETRGSAAARRNRGGPPSRAAITVEMLSFQLSPPIQIKAAVALCAASSNHWSRLQHTSSVPQWQWIWRELVCQGAISAKLILFMLWFTLTH